MLIPSIDLMEGRIVQLQQGERKALEFDDIEAWILRFQNYPLVQLIDLDAAKRRGNNLELAKMILSRLPCQYGGGLRGMEAARELLQAGARKLIFGSALIRDGHVDVDFARTAAEALGSDRIVAAIDSRGGKVAVHGWTQATGLSPQEIIRNLDPYCQAYLYTHIDTEGLMTGIPMSAVLQLRDATERRLIVAGGISSWAEIEELDKYGIDAVVGMALYTGYLSEKPRRHREHSEM
jgi:phosphoribosylformimino-5-aminoimidazole carboxamide ribotide isomerase